MFRNKDVRELAANPDVGNMPTDVLLAVATARDSPVEPGGQLATAQTDGFERFLRNQVFTANPPLHKPSRKIIVRQLTARQIQGFIPAAALTSLSDDTLTDRRTAVLDLGHVPVSGPRQRL